MIYSFRSVALAILVGSYLMLWAPFHAQAAQATPQPPLQSQSLILTFGVIDMERVSDESAPYKKAQEDLTAYKQALVQNLQEVDRYAYLSSGEISELIGILDARELTEAQKSRLAELKKATEEREKEYAALVVIQNPPDDKLKRRQELEQMRAGIKGIFDEVQQKYQQQWNQRLVETDSRLGKMVGNVVEEVAKQQKLTIVIAKSVRITPDSKQDLVYFGGTDITDEVIKRLNLLK